MKRKEIILKCLTIMLLCIASYAFGCRNEFAIVIGALAGVFGLWCCLGWITVARRTPKPYWDDPLYDGTDFAHPAYWRGEDKSCDQFCRLINDVLSGKNKCKGRMREPLESVRNSVFKLKNERDELAHKEEEMLHYIQVLKERNRRQANSISKCQEVFTQTKAVLDLNIAAQSKLEIERDDALEQRDVDWKRIHELEQLLKEEIAAHKILKDWKAEWEAGAAERRWRQLGGSW